ncbi:MAG: hypothetical protein ACHQQ3_09155, partial [Gemmatimonadales bacterium]
RVHLIQHHIAPLAAFAQAHVSETPNMQALKSPPDDISEIDLVATGTALVTAARDYRDRFVKLGFAPGFLEELEGAVADYTLAINSRESAKMQLDAATLGMKAEFPVAWEVVRLIGILIKREFAGRPELLGAWREARTHAPRLRAPDAVKRLPATTGTALVAASAADGAVDAVSPGLPAGVEVAAARPALPPGPDRPTLLRRVFRFFGSDI